MRSEAPGRLDAYWTSTGSGQGSGTVGTSTNNVYVRGTAATALTPETSSSVTFTAKNFAAFGQSISLIHLASVKACSVAWTYGSEASYPVPGAACTGVERTSAECGTIADGSGANDTTKDFYMADVTVDPSAPLGGQLAANADRAVAVTSPSTITMNNAPDNQNDCKNQFLLLTFTTS